MNKFQESFDNIRHWAIFTVGFIAMFYQLYYALSVYSSTLVWMHGSAMVLTGLCMLAYRLKFIKNTVAFAFIGYLIFLLFSSVMLVYAGDHLDRIFFRDSFYAVMLIPMVGVIVSRIHTLIMAIAYVVFYNILLFKTGHEYLEYNVLVVNALVLLYGFAVYVFIGLFLTARNKLNEAVVELTKRKKELDHLNSSKDKLFTIVAHDIKSPMNSILGFSEMMHETYDELSEEERKHQTRLIYKSSSELYELMDRILNWSRTQLDSIVVNKENVHLEEVLNRVHRQLETRIQEKSLSLNIEGDVKQKVLVDKAMLEVVYRNILINAIKFSYEERSVKVELKPENNYLRISVVDSGVGMNSEAVKKIQDSHSFESKKGTGDEKGHGVGLKIVIDFIKRNNGYCTIDSELGKGTSFNFFLPLVESE